MVTTENSPQLNKDKQSRHKLNIVKTNPFLSSGEGIGLETSYAEYKQFLKENIEYDHLVNVMENAA